jgi:ketosteroid isomerase-like protein
MATTRADVESFLRNAYAVRQRERLDEITDLFHPSACFSVLGGDAAEAGVSQCRSVMGGILDSFQLLDHSIESIVIDGDKAAVYWHGKFRAKATDQVGETDLVDVIELKDGRIFWMKSFFDTALAARLAGG